MRCASQLWRLRGNKERANHFRFLLWPHTDNLENHLRSNHFYFVTQTFLIRCHKRPELRNTSWGGKRRRRRWRRKEKSPSRWRRWIYWKSNKFLTQIWRILSLSALMLLGKIKRLHRRYCSPFTVVAGRISKAKIMKLHELKRTVVK